MAKIYTFRNVKKNNKIDKNKFSIEKFINILRKDKFLDKTMNDKKAGK